METSYLINVVNVMEYVGMSLGRLREMTSKRCLISSHCEFLKSTP